MSEGRKTTSSQQGFTLIEVLASIVILTIIITGFMTFFIQAFNFNTKTEDDLQAIHVAQDVLVAIQENPSSWDIGTYQSCELKGNGSLHLEDSDPITNECHYEGTFIYPTVTINQTPSEAELGLYRIHVMVFNQDDRQLTETYGYYSN
ncbi:type IV pilus modification PilV family protein [Desertibacillus haloalkaliphilus]|uniref:type IV pilus modification PilV family protein n=1 Tax=Desertibacillus haloalkaliphilus TaxID=1328930 RepID=UPI001C267C15|nr:prepilin-type N-terminal cleavage/methylation domain-containing protein [Desertibacillus haloalkaliphilus]MBU8905054.1 prepilin-type N-terminal cleavage/methylation domain-containing protein [Desertibacillus haloalkaliphilus]